jgi:hypothetical protein
MNPNKISRLKSDHFPPFISMFDILCCLFF